MKNNTFNGFPLLLKSKILNMAYKIPPYFFPGSSPTTSFSSLKSFLSPTIAQGLCIHTFHNSEILCLPFYLIPTQSSDIGAKLFFQERLPWSSSLVMFCYMLLKNQILFLKSIYLSLYSYINNANISLKSVFPTRRL